MTTPSVSEELRDLLTKIIQVNPANAAKIDERLFCLLEEVIRHAPSGFRAAELPKLQQVQLKAVMHGWPKIVELLEQKQLKLGEIVYRDESEIDQILANIVKENFWDELRFASSRSASDLDALERLWRPLFLSDEEAEKRGCDSTVLLDAYGKRLSALSRQALRAPVLDLCAVFRGYAEKLDDLAEQLRRQTQDKLERASYAPILTALYFAANHAYAQRSGYLKERRMAS